MTVPNPVSMPNPFEDAGSRVPQPGAHASGPDEPSDAIALQRSWLQRPFKPPSRHFGFFNLIQEFFFAFVRDCS